MPVECLSDEQVAAYGRFTGELPAVEVGRFFYLDDADRNVIARRRAELHRLGFAVQLGTVRAVGRSLRTRWTCRGGCGVPGRAARDWRRVVREVARAAPADAMRARVGDPRSVRLSALR